MSPKKVYVLFILALAGGLTLAGCLPPAALETPAPAEASPTLSPQKGVLNIWSREAPTTLNPYFSLGTKDYEPARITYEPLADFDQNGNLVPILAENVPSWENGQLARDNTSVVWKLRRDVFWSDGQPFTAADVVFTYQFITDPLVNVVGIIEYEQIKTVEALDDYTVKITFVSPNPAWALPFVGIRGLILPEHVFEPYKGENAREARANTVPVGTGPYRVKEPGDPAESGIKPQEVLFLGSQVVKTVKIEFEPNPFYRFPEKLAFRKITWRGDGYLREYSRELFVTGDLHLAYEVDPSLMPAQNSKGELLLTSLTGVRRILINFTDPNRPSASGELSSLEVPHPLFSDLRVRQALAHAIDRKTLIEKVYKNSDPAPAVLVAPAQYLSPTGVYDYDPAKANALLDEAGYLDSNGDGFREKDGVKIRLVFQSFVDSDTQIAQGIIRDNLSAIGLDVDVKPTPSSIFFGDDVTHPDSVARFNADLMMFRTTSDSFDPTAFMAYWTCEQIPQQANNWKAGNNNERWCSPEYDALFEKTKTELNPETRAQMFKDLNDMLVREVVAIPLVWEKDVRGVSVALKGINPTPWDSLTWNIQDWYFAQP